MTKEREENQVNFTIKYNWHQNAIIEISFITIENILLPGIFAIPRKTASCTALMPIPKILRPLPKLLTSSAIPLSFANWSAILGGLVLGRLAYREGASDVGRVLG